MKKNYHARQFTIEQCLSLAKKSVKRGDFDGARQLYRSILQQQPEHPVAKKGLQRLQKKLSSAQHKTNLLKPPSETQINDLVNLYRSGKMRESELACKALLKSYQQEIVVHNVLGASLKGQGKLEEAIKAFDSLIRLKPDYSEAYYNRAVIYQDLGQLEASLKDYNVAIQLKSDYADAYYNKANILREQGEFESALESYEKTIDVNPEHIDAHINRGITLRELGQLKEAIQSFDQVVKLKPDFAEVYYNRANILKELGRLEEAVESYDKALALKPGFAESYNNSGIAMKNLGLSKEAEIRFDAAIRLKPNYAEAYTNRGVLFQELGQLELAIKDYKKAIYLKPDYLEAYYNLSIALQSIGLKDMALTCCEKILQLKPDYSEIHRNISLLKTYKPDDQQLKYMADLFSDTHLSKPDRCNLCFALAKAFDDLGEMETSFNYLKKGNSLRKNELGYNINEDKKLFLKIKDIFNDGSDTFNTDLCETTSPIQLVFIVGMPRSGTSLVEQILASHDEVYGAGELEKINRIVTPIFSKLDKQDSAQLSESVIKELGTAYIEDLTRLNMKERMVTDKMPLNFRWIGFILSAFPKAKIINLNRDPRATCWSNYKHYFSGNGNGYAYDLEDLVEFYNQYTALMSFWRERYASNIYEVCYEDLTENQEEETRKLLEYCGLSWEKECLDFYKTERVIKTASAHQVRQKMYKGSSDAWKIYKKQIAPLLKRLGG